MAISETVRRVQRTKRNRRLESREVSPSLQAAKDLIRCAQRKTVQTLVLDFYLRAMSKTGDGGGPRCHVPYFETHVKLSDSFLVHRPDGHGKVFSPKLIWTLDSCGTG